MRVQYLRLVILAPLLALLAAATCCARTPKPWHPYPVSVASVASLCAPGRKVYCEQGNPECAAVQGAVAAIDAVVPGLLVYAGELSRAALVKAFESGDVTVVVRGVGVPADYQRLPIAVTQMNPNGADACLRAVPIILVWPSAALSDADWRQVVLHEMLHALGAAHADGSCPYSTVMHVALEQEHRVGLSGADKNWLRAVYAQD